MGGFGFKFGPYEMRGTLEGLGNTLQEERDKFLQDKLLKLHQVEYALENAPRAAFQALPAFGVAAGPFSLEKASPSSLFDDRYLAKQQPPPVGIKEAQEALNKRRVGPNLDAPWEGPPVAAAEVEPPPRPGYSVVERDGKRVYTNLPGVGKELAYVPPEGGSLPKAYHLPVGERIGGGLSPGGQREFATVREGPGGFAAPAPPLTAETWDEVKTEPNPILRADWLRRNMEGAPIEALEADLGLKAAEAEMNRRQGDRFAAETARLRMSPLDRALEQTNIPLERYVEQQSKIDPDIKIELEFRQLEFIRRYLVAQGLLKEGQRVQAAPPGAVTEQLERYARTQAVLEYIKDRDTSLQETAARQGIGLNPYGG